jgi:parallel beta-helix repeat protein
VVEAEGDTMMAIDVENGFGLAATPRFGDARHHAGSRYRRALAPLVALATLVAAAHSIAADCTSPTVIPAAGGTVTGTTSGTSVLAGTCEPGPTGGAPETVFQWMPEVSGTATVETCSGTATTYDTVLYVRAAGCLDGPELACNDDTPGCGTTTDPADPHRGSRVSLEVEEGKLYFIIVDGFSGSAGGAAGSFSLTVMPPVPTTSTVTATTSTTTSTLTAPCSLPTVIPPAGGTVTGTTSGASTLTGVCEPVPTAGAPEKVFEWTPDVSGTATIETCSATATTFDTVLYVRTAGCADGLELACNDDTQGCGTTTDPADPHRGSRVTVEVEAGKVYFLVVDGFDGSQGGSAGNFSLTVIPPGGGPTTTTTTSTTGTTSLPTSSTTVTGTTSTTTTTRRTTTTTTTKPSTTSTTLAGGGFCGEDVKARCQVRVDKPARSFTSVQAAIDAASPGATITVTGLCAGPVKVHGRYDLTIQGTPPASGCPSGGPGPSDLTSTIRGGRDLVSVSHSSNIVVQFLNLVGADQSGVKMEDGRNSVVHCNCVARNRRNGVRLDDGWRQEVSQNLVARNGRDGIQLEDCKDGTVLDNTSQDNRGDGLSLEDGKRNLVLKNLLRRNGGAGINLDETKLVFLGYRGLGIRNEENTVGENVAEDNDGDGIRLKESDKNDIVGNTVRRNAADGIDLEEADRNRLTDNQVTGNGTLSWRDSGIELLLSNRNVLDGNVIRDNADGLVDRARCLFGSRNNSGSNAGSRCR